MDYINDLHEMCDTLSHELREANEKISNGGGKLSGSDLDYVDKLTHALKSIKTTIAMVEAEDGGSYNDGSYGMYPHWNYGGFYADRNMNGNGGSYARGRNARRDSMGRYSSAGYSYDYKMDLEELMRDAPNERVKAKLRDIMQGM